MVLSKKRKSQSKSLDDFFVLKQQPINTERYILVVCAYVELTST